jgi:very-short-patch-repair endonuclease
LDLVLESLPDEAPAVVTYRPSVVASAGAVVREALGELESVAIGLVPAWLPEARYIEGQSSASVAAVRALAHQAAEHHESYGPFLAELAERAQRAAPRRSSRIPAEVRAAGLATVIAKCLERAHVAVLVYLQHDLTVHGERSVVDACEWLAHHGGLAVWLAGAPLSYVDRVSTAEVEVTGSLAEIVQLAKPSDPATEEPDPISRSGLTYPAARGVPHTDHEKAVATILATKDWARGHRWNHRLHLDVLNPPYVVDLFFESERCIVEIDGDDHRRMPKFERDRRRDVDLQTAGYAVLRFTNDQVSTNLEGVLVLIQRFLDSRRQAERREQHRATR